MSGRGDRRKRPPKNTGVLVHLICLLLTFLGTLFLFLVLLLNVPIPGEDAPLAVDVRHRFWLVEITDVGAREVVPPIIPDSTIRQGKREIVELEPGLQPHPQSLGQDQHQHQHEQRQRHDVSAPRRRQHKTRIDSPDPETDRGVATLPELVVTAATATLTAKPNTPTESPSINGAKEPGFLANGSLVYGFGAYGWCEWVQGDNFGYAYCRTKAFWQLPRDIYPGDTVEQLLVPSLLATSLSIASFFIIFGTASGVFAFISLLIAIFDPPLSPVDPNKTPIPNDGLSTGTWFHYTLVNTTHGILGIVFHLGWCLPTLAIAGIAVSRVNEPGGEHIAGLGSGVGFLAAGMSLLIMSKIIQMSMGLRVNRRTV